VITVPFDRYLVTLRFTRPAGFHFLHGGAVNGLLCNALQTHPLPHGVIPFAPESGRVRFEPEDEYNLGVTLVGETRGLIEPLLDGLRRVGVTQPPRGQPLPAFGGNFEVATSTGLPMPDLDEEAAALATGEEVRLRFVSPMRMSRPPALREPGATFLNRDCFPVPHFIGRLWAHLFRLAQGRDASAEERDGLRPPLPAAAVADAGRLLWLDLPVPGRRGSRAARHARDRQTSAPDAVDAAAGQRPHGLTLGGIVGSLTLNGVPEAWLPFLALARHLHVGENTRFGLGRMRIAADGLPSDPFRPAATLLASVARKPALAAALSHVVSHSVAPGIDGVSPREASQSIDAIAAELAAQLVEGAYEPAPLAGILLPKDGNKVRPLAVPTVRDRGVQRSACELLGPAIDTLLEDSSFAYRRGLSRAAAAVAVQQAHDDGFRWVLDADIESFFDCVAWDGLFAKLDALYPDEPLMDVIRRWVAAPVVFEGSLIPRQRGLPQGAVVSPLLANLFLDELDEDLLQQGFRLVRYADDFVVLCRNLEAARAAQESARQALARLQLSLNLEKSAIRTFDGGFSYLGYLFCRSLVLDRERRECTHDPDALQPTAVPRDSWLAAVPFENVREALTRRRAAPIRRAPHDAKPLTSVAPVLRPLYITDPAAELAVAHDKLVVSSPTDGNREIGIRTLSHVVMVGRVRATVPALLALSRLGVPCYFVRRTGQLYAELGPHQPQWALWEAQAARAADPAARLAFARSIVEAKLHNTAAVASRHKLQGCGDLADELRELERRCLEQTDADALRGLEGRGAAAFFAAFRESLPEGWSFPGRRRNPPPDPVNAMLSFAYTIVYNHVSTALVAAGLHPRIGLFHTRRGAYHALACDLQEEFRHLAESHTIAMIRRREITPDDFVASTDGRYPCLLSHEARRTFVRSFERRLLVEFTPAGDEQQTSYLGFIDRQAHALRAVVEGQAQAYEPLRIHA